MRPKAGCTPSIADQRNGKLSPMSNLAEGLFSAMCKGTPHETSPGLTLQEAYRIESEMQGLRDTKPVGLKVGFANKAIWRVLKLETLAWAHMYDDTVHYEAREYKILHARPPKLEPEIVFKMKSTPDGTVEILRHVEWYALGFEIIDCPYPDWKFQPADFVAAGGLHQALIIGTPVAVDAQTAEQLANFKVKVHRNGEFVEEGSGKNSLKSPALCLTELAARTTLRAGELVSSGTLTTGHLISSGERWRAQVEGIPCVPLELDVV